jgi:hypothetical protein
MTPESAISVLERWEGCGAVWKAIFLSDEIALVDLCTCYGEPVERIETRDADAIAYVRDRLEDEQPDQRPGALEGSSRSIGR